MTETLDLLYQSSPDLADFATRRDLKDMAAQAGEISVLSMLEHISVANENTEGVTL